MGRPSRLYVSFVRCVPSVDPLCLKPWFGLWCQVGRVGCSIVGAGLLGRVYDLYSICGRLDVDGYGEG